MDSVTLTPAASAVFAAVLTRGPLSRTEVSRMTGLSSAAVTKAVRPILAAGYLDELPVGRAVPGSGRPAAPLAVRAEREFSAGVRVTAGELVTVVTDLRARVRGTRRVRPAGTGPAAVAAAIAEALAALRQTLPPVRRLGVAVPGEVDKAPGVVRRWPSQGWRDVPLAALVRAATGLPVTVENDVKALTVTEQWFGEGVGTRSFALVTVGARVGCGLVVNGALVEGGYGVAGEIGHVPVDGAGPPCACGGRGCVEAIAAEHAIAARRGVDFPEALALAAEGDRAAREAFAAAGRAVGRGIAAMVNMFGPEKVVVAGEAVPGLLAEHIRAAYGPQAFGAAGGCPLVTRPLPAHAWARGAAAVTITDLVNRPWTARGRA
ncbi:ROK family transcriptional regulator [Nonomuraea typhae]|uniref:ROK family transcriptional regulator n=1 Tax=Nonomuraea typhae TaxID=2603600 RepID=UPI0012FCB087|nr:ROK family transcriptional regulator [Nonomuraea typhae]